MTDEELFDLGARLDLEALRLTHLASELHLDDCQRVVSSIAEIRAPHEEAKLLDFLARQT